MRVVLDTNVIVSAFINKEGHSAQIIHHIRDFAHYTSEEILSEFDHSLHYQRIQGKYQLSDRAIREYVSWLRTMSKVIQPLPVKVVDGDPDDNKFLACGKKSKADYLVSGDPHLAVSWNFAVFVL